VCRQCYHSIHYDNLAMDLTNRHIRHYRVLSRLGAGGMGEVYLGRDEKLHRNVAIKVLLPNAMGDETAQLRFMREARTVATLDHPNICSVYDVGDFEGLTYIVLQHIEGETLGARLRRGPMPLDAALDVAAQVAAALGEAHRHGIVHRDVKPENIMITARGQVKVLDFGLAKNVSDTRGKEAESNLTTPGFVIGTLPYMSPEQVRGDEIDARSDIFSFGCVLYEMLTEKRLFFAASPAEVIAAVLTRELPPLMSGTTPGVESIEPMLRRTLEKESSRRYPSIDLVIDELHLLRSGPTARPISENVLTELQVATLDRRRRLRLIIAAIAIGLIVAVGGFLLWQRQSPLTNGPTMADSTSRIRQPSTARNPIAQDYYLRARVNISNENSASNEAAIKLLENAIAIDPGFAEAHATLARAYHIKSFYFASKGEKEKLEEDAAVQVERALALNPDLAEGHLARGMVLWSHENRFPHEQAIESYRRAIALDPKLDEAHHQLGVVYFHIGLLDQARSEIEKAVALNPGNTLARLRFGVIDMYRGRYEDALTIFKSTPLKKNPSLWAFQSANSLSHLGKEDEASRLLDSYLAQYPGDQGGVGTSVKAVILAKRGKRQEAEALIGRAISLGEGYGHFHHTAYNIASAYALMKQPEQALKWLQIAADDGFPCYPLYADDPYLDSLRSDPRFELFMKKLRERWESARKNV